MDLVIEGRFFINGELKDTAVGIEDGKIVTVGNIVRGGDERIELKNKIILPGFMDPHVHFRGPRRRISGLGPHRHCSEE